MSWMSLPVTSYDKYVDPVNGSDSNNGNTWATAYLTCAKAAAASGNYGRIWLAPGDHTFTSTVSYTDKRLHWIGPPIPAGFTDDLSGAALFTGTGLTEFIDVEASTTNLYGGGFHSIAFDMGAIADGGQAINTHHCNYFVFEDLHARAPSATAKTCYLIRDEESTNSAAWPSEDRSWGTVRDCSVFNCGLFYAGRAYNHTNRGLNGWSFHNVKGTCDDASGMTVPYIDVYQVHFRAWLQGGYFTNTPRAVRIDQRNANNAALMVTISGYSFADLLTPYYGVELYDGQVAVQFAGGNGTTDGLIYGDSATTGYMAVPSGSLAGSLVPGEN